MLLLIDLLHGMYVDSRHSGARGEVTQRRGRMDASYARPQNETDSGSSPTLARLSCLLTPRSTNYDLGSYQSQSTSSIYRHSIPRSQLLQYNSIVICGIVGLNLRSLARPQPSSREYNHETLGYTHSLSTSLKSASRHCGYNRTSENIASTWRIASADILSVMPDVGTQLTFSCVTG